MHVQHVSVEGCVCLNGVHGALTWTNTSTAFDIDTLRVLTLITSSTDWIQPCKQQVKMTSTSQQPQFEVSTDPPKLSELCIPSCDPTTVMKLSVECWSISELLSVVVKHKNLRGAVVQCTCSTEH